MAALLKHKLELGDGDPRTLLRFFFLTLISLIFQDSTMGFVCTVFLHLIICWRINYDKELDIYRSTYAAVAQWRHMKRRSIFFYQFFYVRVNLLNFQL